MVYLNASCEVLFGFLWFTLYVTFEIIPQESVTTLSLVIVFQNLNFYFLNQNIFLAATDHEMTEEEHFKCTCGVFLINTKCLID